MADIGAQAGVAPRFVSKTVTFTGASGAGLADVAVPVFTVTGQVVIWVLAVYCTTLLTESGATATVALGTAANTALLTPATNAVDIDANEFWDNASPQLSGTVLPALHNFAALSGSVIITPAVANVTGGVLRFDLYWLPLSSDGNVVAS